MSPVPAKSLLSQEYTSTLFKREFEHARQTFLENAQRLLETQELANLSTVYQSAEFPCLATDVLYVGPENSDRILVLISATHGIEGYTGSAIQSFIAEQLASSSLSLPGNTSIMMIHALNAWGMYWARRCDEHGIDLNRNFADFSQLPCMDPKYPEILACLEIEDASTRHHALEQLSSQLGPVEFDKAFSGGQYTHPWAPFYGGQEPATGHKIIEQTISNYSLSNREIVVLDLHTGLGPWSYGELISDHSPGSVGERYAREMFGPAVASTFNGESFSVPKHGLMDYYWHKYMQQLGCYLTLEFGTYGTTTLFNTLLDEHLYWHLNPVNQIDDPRYLKIRETMLQHFCPPDVTWQQAVLFKGWQTIQQVISKWKQ